MDTLIPGPRPAEARIQGVRVLVVEDDPAIVRFLEMYLTQEGLSVSSALAGEEGLAQAEKLRPDLILLDHTLSGLDGAEVLRRLRERPETSQTPVILLVSGGDWNEGVKTFGFGVDDYLTKPFDIRELKARLWAALARKRGRDDSMEAMRVRTVREVVASVSHEVNNPLAAILMCAEAVEARRKEDSYVSAKCRTIQENAMRIRDILKRMERLKFLGSKPYTARDRILDLDATEET